jgi:hypothetical protein
MFDPISAAFGVLLGGLVATEPTPLPTCEEQKKENSSAYRLQNGGWSRDGFVGARPMKTCR